MNPSIAQRLADLRQEFDTGNTRLKLLEQEQLRLRETLLRISGAIQVLEELQAAPSDSGAPSASGAGSQS